MNTNEFRLRTSSPLFRYCDCANQIRFRNPSESVLAEKQLDKRYSHLTNVAETITSPSDVESIKTSSAWMAACTLYLAQKRDLAVEWAKFVGMDKLYAWAPDTKSRIMAKATMQLLHGDASGYAYVKSAWFPTCSSYPKYLSLADKQFIYSSVTSAGVSTKLLVIGSVYLSVLDVYECLSWNESAHYNNGRPTCFSLAEHFELMLALQKARKEAEEKEAAEKEAARLKALMAGEFTSELLEELTEEQKDLLWDQLLNQAASETDTTVVQNSP